MGCLYFDRLFLPTLKMVGLLTSTLRWPEPRRRLQRFSYNVTSSFILKKKYFGHWPGTNMIYLVKNNKNRGPWSRTRRCRWRHRSVRPLKKMGVNQGERDLFSLAAGKSVSVVGLEQNWNVFFKTLLGLKTIHSILSLKTRLLNPRHQNGPALPDRALGLYT